MYFTQAISLRGQNGSLVLCSWLWSSLDPYLTNQTPRGFSSIVIGIVYHPPSADTKSMLEYLFKSLTEIESQYPNCWLSLARDFSRLDVKSFVRHFKMKQLVHLPTRKNQTLDLTITNLFQHYSSDSLSIHPLFGLSDHNVVTLYPKERSVNTQTKKAIKKETPAGKENWGDIYVLSIGP